MATGLPLLLGGLDGALLAGIVIDAGACTDHCLAGVVLLVVAPVSTPLEAAALDARAVGALTILAVLLVLALAALWWRTIARAAAELATGRRRPIVVFWAVWVGAVVATYAVTLLAAGLYVTVGAVAAFVAEVVVWAAVVSQLPAVTSRRHASDPLG